MFHIVSLLIIPDRPDHSVIFQDSAGTGIAVPCIFYKIIAVDRDPFRKYRHFPHISSVQLLFSLPKAETVSGTKTPPGVGIESAMPGSPLYGHGFCLIPGKGRQMTLTHQLLRCSGFLEQKLFPFHRRPGLFRDNAQIFTQGIEQVRPQNRDKLVIFDMKYKIAFLTGIKTRGLSHHQKFHIFTCLYDPDPADQRQQEQNCSGKRQNLQFKKKAGDRCCSQKCDDRPEDQIAGFISYKPVSQITTPWSGLCIPLLPLEMLSLPPGLNGSKPARFLPNG